MNNCYFYIIICDNNYILINTYVRKQTSPIENWNEKISKYEGEYIIYLNSLTIRSSSLATLFVMEISDVICYGKKI